MSLAVKASTFDELTLDEQILHVQDLWDRIAARPEHVPVTEAHRAELGRRLADLDEHGSQGAPWDIVRERIRRR